MTVVKGRLPITFLSTEASFLQAAHRTVNASGRIRYRTGLKAAIEHEPAIIRAAAWLVRHLKTGVDATVADPKWR